MTRRASTGRALLGLSAGAVLLVLAAAPARAQTDSGHSHVHKRIAEALPATPQSYPSDSIYQLGSIWTDQDGVEARLGSLRGRPQMVAMIYTSCQYECPLIVERMLQLARALPEDVKAKVGFALFSFDPDRDSVAALQAYAAKHDLDERRWRLRRARLDDVQELAVALGVRFRKEPNGDFSHSSIITVLDREGVIRYQLMGLNQDSAPLVQALIAAARP